MELTVSERNLVENLRKKYADLAEPNSQTSLDAAIAQQVACMDSSCNNSGRCSAPGANRVRQTSEDIEVKLCEKCKGAGELHEHYGYRVITSACDICDGRGAKTYRQGKLVTTEDMDKEAAAKGTKPVWAQNATERISRLTTDIQKIQAKINGYADEASGLKGSLNDATAPEERELKEALIAQLQKQIEEMGKALHRREQSLKRYTNPTTGIAKEDLDDLENANQPVRV